MLWSLKTSILLTAAVFIIPLSLYGDNENNANFENHLENSENTENNVDNNENQENNFEIPEENGAENSAGNNANENQNGENAENIDNNINNIAGERDGEKILKVLHHKTGKIIEMDLGVYLIRVLCGEMPANFEPEALKAQAVAARTYTRYMLSNGGKHGGKADICTDSNCCQAYSTDMTDQENLKLKTAVESTDGEIMLYNNKPVLAVFHSSSAGLTRTAGDVWSGDQPYLQPVESPEDSENIPNYYSRMEFEIDNFRTKIKNALPSADLSGPVDTWISDSNTRRDSAGSVIKMQVGGVEIQGSKMRSILNLRSACFTWEIADNKFIFYVTGFGHGVGMSQYGANQMAKNGANYREILTHYYTGVEIGGYTP